MGVAMHTQLTQWEHLALSTGNLAPIQFFGRFENLEEDWSKVCKILGVYISLPHKNKSRDRGYRHYYDDETRKIVEKRNTSLIERFAYEF